MILERQVGLRCFCFSRSTVLTADSNSRRLRRVGSDAGRLTQTVTVVRTESPWARPHKKGCANAEWTFPRARPHKKGCANAEWTFPRTEPKYLV